MFTIVWRALDLSQACAWDRGTTIDEYDAGVAYVDDSIGRLLAQFKPELGLAGNTILVLTSDHGESLGVESPHLPRRRSLLGTNLTVPLIITYPGHLLLRPLES